jgi:hypothetical protein
MSSVGVSPFRVYADTSVYGGVFDEEFSEASRRFFEQVSAGRYQLVTCALLDDEPQEAPDCVRDWFDHFEAGSDLVEVSDEAVRLQQGYLDAGIVGPKWEADALHVAVASVSRCRLIVSWNFRHVVKFRRMPLYTAVNAARGYGAIAIHSPQEVTQDEDEDV